MTTDQEFDMQCDVLLPLNLQIGCQQSTTSMVLLAMRVQRSKPSLRALESFRKAPGKGQQPSQSTGTHRCCCICYRVLLLYKPLLGESCLHLPWVAALPLVRNKRTQEPSCCSDRAQCTSSWPRDVLSRQVSSYAADLWHKEGKAASAHHR